MRCDAQQPMRCDCRPRPALLLGRPARAGLTPRRGSGAQREEGQKSEVVSEVGCRGIFANVVFCAFCDVLYVVAFEL